MLADSESRQVVAEDGKRYSVVSSAVDDAGWSALSPLCRDVIMRSDGSLLD